MYCNIGLILQYMSKLHHIRSPDHISPASLHSELKSTQQKFSHEAWINCQL